jgi:hypothetical protein
VIRPEENEVIEAESAFFEATEALVIAMKERGMSRQEAWGHLERLQGEAGVGLQEKETAKTQFEMIWPEGT